MCEDAPCCGCCGPEPFDNEPSGFPGDGSGMDDLADHNANEADDFRDEGDDHDLEPMEDQHLDGMFEGGEE